MSAQSRWEGFNGGVQLGRVLGTLHSIERAQQYHHQRLEAIAKTVEEIRAEWEAVKHWARRALVVILLWLIAGAGLMKADDASGLLAAILRKLIGL